MAGEQENEAPQIQTHWDGVGPLPAGWPEIPRIPIPPDVPTKAEAKAKARPKKPTE